MDLWTAKANEEMLQAAIAEARASIIKQNKAFDASEIRILVDCALDEHENLTRRIMVKIGDQTFFRSRTNNFTKRDGIDRLVETTGKSKLAEWFWGLEYRLIEASTSLASMFRASKTLENFKQGLKEANHG